MGDSRTPRRRTDSVVGETWKDETGDSELSNKKIIDTLPDLRSPLSVREEVGQHATRRPQGNE
ncbi:hypothetical protein GCM10027271_25260 [Saccharopolyspora gloriosae]|uniref:Uncharacterized protein n=1 Tax=Saccharopolyspora gloriosae TaxID=455344 RepID=A0A840NGS6_9PSEU|nr:hypothetical protein [Saccharopolyspora gloriosae]MBB5071636.1 hypothetical protein [Saccharopolyspora gloriosae]